MSDNPGSTPTPMNPEQREANLPTVTQELPNEALETFARYYTLRTYCKNCGRHSGVYILKGVRAFGLSVNCENCECPINL